MEGREKTTDMEDVNKELSQLVVRPYINYAEALRDLATGLNKALAHWGSIRHKTKLLCCEGDLFFKYYISTETLTSTNMISNGRFKP